MKEERRQGGREKGKEGRGVFEKEVKRGVMDKNEEKEI